jgi:glycosyltransferase involved in cell wall biosynthesis
LGWELHLVGSVARNGASRLRVESLTSEARGLPVFFHFDIDLDDLRGLYRGASVYWHATGYGLPSQRPEGLEHFGMTTVEAMSAGAVPVVIDAGGQTEIVSHAVDGFLWKSLDALRNLTRQLIADDALRTHMSARAVASSARFGRADFNRRMDHIIARLAATEALA